MRGLARIIHLARDRSGTALAEFALIVPLLTLLLLGIVEFGVIMWQTQQAELAAARALRFATTRDMLSTSMDDCLGPSGTSTASAGTSCSEVAGSTGWSFTCSPTSSGNCDAAMLDRMLADVQAAYPQVEANNLVVRFEGAGMGFKGFGRPVPMVTVTLTDIPYDFVAIGGFLGATTFTMRDISAGAPAEDLAGA